MLGDNRWVRRLLYWRASLAPALGGPGQVYRKRYNVASFHGQPPARHPRRFRWAPQRVVGSITKAGHSRPRWLLIQAAVSILRRRPPQAEELRTWALCIAAHRTRVIRRLRQRAANLGFALVDHETGEVLEGAVS